MLRQLWYTFKLTHISCLVLMAAAAYGLYYVKFQVLELQRQIAAQEEQLDRELEHLHVVEAEWAYLTRPDRLQELVSAHTTLKPVAGMQVQQVAALPFPPADEEHPNGLMVAEYEPGTNR